MKAIVSLILSRGYQAKFRRYCYSSWKAYADRHGLSLLLFTEPFDFSERAASRSPAWQKCLAVVSEEARRYEQVAWLDSDILIHDDKAPNVFEGIPLENMAAVGDFLFPSPEVYRSRLQFLEEHWRDQGAPVVSALTPQNYYQAFPLPPLDRVAQTGVLVLNPQVHEPVFRRTYDKYEDRGSSTYHYEMRPLSYEMITTAKMSWLDPRFNTVISFSIEDCYLNDLVEPHSFTERVGRKLEIPISARQRRLRLAYRNLLQESFFLHFAGRQAELFLV